MATNGIHPPATHDSGEKTPVKQAQPASWAAIAIIYLFTFATWMPWHANGYVATRLTNSWQMVLRWAFIHQWDVGHKLAFTYGPWGFAITGYDRQTFVAQLAVWALLSAGFTTGIVALTRSLRLRVALPLMFFLVVLVGSNCYEFLDLRPLSLAWLLLVIGLFVDRQPSGFVPIVLVICLALASQLKFTTGMMAVGVLLALTIHASRKILWLAIIYAAAYVFFWLLAGQHIASLPAYFNHSLHIAGAYADMESTFMPDEARGVIIFLIGCTALLALLIGVNWRQWRLTITSVLAIVLCFFLMFKAGFIRHDSHEIEATGGLAILSALLAIALWNRQRRQLQCLIAAVVLLNFGLLWRTYALFGADGLPMQLCGSVLKLILPPIPMKDLPKTDLPQVHGSVDIYPWGQDVLLAAGLDYHPRPVFQSYLAESPFLAELNAQHLRGPDAPDAILFRPETIDEQFPALADATSWPELLSRYDLADASKSWLLYRRAESARLLTIIRGPAITGKLGQPINLPIADTLIWARIDLRLTRFGKINHVLYKSPKLTLLVRTADGQEKAFRFIPTIAREGFLLSPAVTEPMTFALLQSSTWQKELAGLKVKSITIVCDQSGMPPCLMDEFECSFDRLNIPTRDLSGVPGIARNSR